MASNGFILSSQLIMIPFLAMIITHTQILVRQGIQLRETSHSLQKKLENAKNSIALYPIKGPTPLNIQPFSATPKLLLISASITPNILFEYLIPHPNISTSSNAQSSQ